MRRMLKALERALLVGLFATTSVAAQSSTITVIGSDSGPVPYAWVAVRGGQANITDEHGKLSLGGGHNVKLAVEVRRIGFVPWSGNIAIADTATNTTIVLRRLAQAIGAVTVTAAKESRDPALAGFYDRWLMRQKGALSATFIGPEEIEFRHPARPSDLLEGVNGVRLLRTDRGSVIARGNGGTCFMSVMLDGRQLCPAAGCHVSDNANAPQIGRGMAPPSNQKLDDVTVNLNQYVDANDIVAVEVYARGANMPISLQALDAACGVIAIWTGARK
jgi:hypothetical protein